MSSEEGLEKEHGGDYVKFLGTAGARFVVSRQLRASGGLWISLNGLNMAVDPGPGALVRMHSSRPKLDPAKLDAVILSHRHLDHASDANVLVEAMTDGGRKRRGRLLLPSDSMGDEPAVFSYARQFVAGVDILAAGKSFDLGNGVTVSTPVRHRHPVETYGFVFDNGRIRVSIIADTLYFPELAEHYKADYLIMNVVLMRQPENRIIEHLVIDDVKTLAALIRPKAAIITHFGMTMVNSEPFKIAAALSEETGVRVIDARDGMTFRLDGLGAPRGRMES